MTIQSPDMHDSLGVSAIGHFSMHVDNIMAVTINFLINLNGLMVVVVAVAKIYLCNTHSKRNLIYQHLQKELGLIFGFQYIGVV
ncbi:hypothetical protein RIR_e44127_A0A2I1G232_9GLOM [Rhizophagus irregularis DAOM 181602=DAOM 197198]|nr:hypothetical protein RIR_e44127_A0A2I1G232_9GLOM [Rhizophagus irregularis DAOM 181602=DAOM 197198]